MVLCGRIIVKANRIFRLSSEAYSIFPNVYKSYFSRFSSSTCSAVKSYSFLGNAHSHQPDNSIDLGCKHDADAVIDKVLQANCDTEVFQLLLQEFGFEKIRITHSLVDRLLIRFQDDWKSALGVFRWVQSCSGYNPSPELYDKLVDILGKMKEMEKMKALLQEMQEGHLISLKTVAKVMRRFAGAGEWKDAVKTFDELEDYGLEKNTESMNLLLDTLCKEHKVEQARDVFLELKQHIRPNANTFNIFIHGWCKIKRVEEAQWTIEEMKGHGLRPCVISYSTIIQFYCFRGNFQKVYELLDEMEVQKCPPNVVTFTTIMHSLTKNEEFNEALRVAEKAKLSGCELDTQFYNALIHSLGRAQRVEDAIYVFTEEMCWKSINPNTSTYNTMIAMFCHHGQENRAVEYLRNLENSSCCKPDVQSYYPLLKLYFRNGKIDTCLAWLLDDMVRKQHLCLDLATFTLLIHGLCRANRCEWAYRLFEDMVGQNVKPRYVTCSMLLREIRLKNMFDAADMVESYMRKMKSS
ncbi:pentatricopeptide repeat-containing protein At3g04130, mitochondrial [Andrographis paniculata]|uniref:pentatricopeptide repeat-containing protein At3g04130, mitochondrial n=1 Tax=Andrographis paniculata TaxID=175694 RepID=UPI0021E87EDD|nr:pentatricopeptide repeat-containing protein At3g04130, mitochondrial [Andrographis paniculata]